MTSCKRYKEYKKSLNKIPKKRNPEGFLSFNRKYRKYIRIKLYGVIEEVLFKKFNLH